ncbi:alpha/beta hydrolase [Catenovulum sp. SM1970]|uniref:alpha/beta hydrolase n=1 Tax=Marinifaba aquimaris TaxID=2741323 RepID=UPI00157300D6|nr:alpha/beta hydrolase [Marinifaba aquimaris]NTS76297.1 alpha/beta hydrolase [Marinifaba aquimaris]
MLKQFISSFLLAFCAINPLNATTIFDKHRDRAIPAAIHFPDKQTQCSTTTQCPVAFISNGYGVPHTEYQFLVELLTQAGYLTVSVGHEIKNDPPLAVSGDLFKNRSENWQRGAATLAFLQQDLAAKYPSYNFKKILLVGHSNGGDISAWYATEKPALVDKIITLDHRRVPLPRNPNLPILSIRASDFPADKGVLPEANNRQKHAICVVKIADAKHNDMTDLGPSWLTQHMTESITRFLDNEAIQTQKTGQNNPQPLKG